MSLVQQSSGFFVPNFVLCRSKILFGDSNNHTSGFRTTSSVGCLALGTIALTKEHLEEGVTKYLIKYQSHVLW